MILRAAVLGVVLAGIAAVGVVSDMPGARAAAIVALGRAAGCPIDRAMDTHRQEKLQLDLKDKILAASKLVRSDDQGFELYDTPKGPYWVPKGNQYVLPFNLAEIERNIYGQTQHGVKPGDVVLDCGASDGDFVKEALRLGARQVVAIEISPKNIECLRRNLTEEIAQGRAVIYPKGVWDKDDTLPLNEDDTNFAADSVVMMQPNSRKTTTMVPLTTIDKMVEELKLERVDYIKMDIEGAEPRALEGARQTIARWHPRMGLSVYHQPDHPYTIPEIAKHLWPGYRIEYGPCEEDRKGFRIHPQVMYFY